MKVLVVHDREEVVSDIVELLQALEVSKDRIEVANDGVSARRLLQERLFDLAIVDLTIPHIKGKSEINYAIAEGLLSEVFSTDTLNTPGDIIGITKDALALESISSDIGPHLMAVVEEDSAGAWKKRMSDRIRYVQKAAVSRQRSINQHYDYDVAIFTALDEEFAPFNDIFEFSAHPYFAGLKTFLFEDGRGVIRRGVALAIGEAGQAPAASMVQSVISQFRPSLCLMSGFCGGFTGKVKIGQAILAESVFNWDCGKWKGDGDAAEFFPRPDPITIKGTPVYEAIREFVKKSLVDSAEILGNATTLSGGDITELLYDRGFLASGSAVVGHKSVIKRIQGLNDKIAGVDMEAYGLYYAAKYAPVKAPDVLVIKAVADYADGDKSDKYHASCSYIAAKLVHNFICRFWQFS